MSGPIRRGSLLSDLSPDEPGGIYACSVPADHGCPSSWRVLAVLVVLPELRRHHRRRDEQAGPPSATTSAFGPRPEDGAKTLKIIDEGAVVTVAGTVSGKAAEIRADCRDNGERHQLAEDRRDQRQDHDAAVRPQRRLRRGRAVQDRLRRPTPPPKPRRRRPSRRPPRPRRVDMLTNCGVRLRGRASVGRRHRRSRSSTPTSS